MVVVNLAYKVTRDTGVFKVDVCNAKNKIESFNSHLQSAMRIKDVKMLAF